MIKITNTTTFNKIYHASAEATALAPTAHDCRKWCAPCLAMVFSRTTPAASCPSCHIRSEAREYIEIQERPSNGSEQTINIKVIYQPTPSTLLPFLMLPSLSSTSRSMPKNGSVAEPVVVVHMHVKSPSDQTGETKHKTRVCLHVRVHTRNIPSHIHRQSRISHAKYMHAPTWLHWGSAGQGGDHVSSRLGLPVGVHDRATLLACAHSHNTHMLLKHTI